VPKQIAVQCSAQIAAVLVEALQWFVARNYPYGADECSIAAREALLDLAERFRRELIGAGRSSYSSRIRAFLCEAVSSYTRQLEQDTAVCYSHRRAELIEVCRGLSSGDGYALAAQRDEQSSVSGRA
jgi:hypothetical protein